MDARLSFFNLDGVAEPGERRRLESLLHVATDAVEILCIDEPHPLPKCTPRFLDHEHHQSQLYANDDSPPPVLVRSAANPPPVRVPASVPAPAPVPVTKPVTVQVSGCNGDLHKSPEPAEPETQSPRDIPKTNGAPPPTKDVCGSTISNLTYSPLYRVVSPDLYLKRKSYFLNMLYRSAFIL
jgi:hypothetical protein